MELRIYIKSRIKKAGLSVSEVSAMLGYSSPAGLSNMLRNPKKLSVEKAGDLALIIKDSPSSLLSRIYRANI